MPNIYDMADEWNAGATVFTAIKMNVDDQASHANSMLMDLQVNDTSKFRVFKDGIVRINPTGTGEIVFGSSGGESYLAIGAAALNYGAAGRVAGVSFGFVGDDLDDQDLILARDAQDALAQRRGANAQITRGYRTFTDVDNYERWALQSGAGYFEWAAETAGSGTDNIDLRLTPAGAGRVIVTGQMGFGPFDIGSHPGLYFDGRSPQNAQSSIFTDTSDVLYIHAGLGNGKPIQIGDSSRYLQITSSSMSFTNSNVTTCRFGTDAQADNNVFIFHNDTNAAAVVRGYRTRGSDDPISDYERWALQSGAGYFEWAAETAGTGTDDIDLRLTPAGNGQIDFRNSDSAAAAQAGTLTNAPTAGNPTFWLTVKINGTALAIPAWALP